VKLLANPLVVDMLLGLIGVALVFLITVMIMRWMRRRLNEETSFAPDVTSDETLPLHTFHAVIQELKQQKHELESTQQVERRRAKTSENISAAVLSNLSSGVMFFTPDGLIRQANIAAKRILGYASPVGTTVTQVFREAALLTASGSLGANLAETVRSNLRERIPFLQEEARYLTPAGEERILDITLTAVCAPGGETLGAACLINDRTEVARIRRQQQLRGEVSSEMALDLHNSLNTISSYAQRLVVSRDPELARQLAADIAAEAAHLDHTIGGFLSGARTARIASGT
jgi:nitrogen fixation/metabolism regulation signal transduction histidine kinase